MKRIVIIGAGLAGMTAALRLCRRFEVDLLEADARPGGQIHTDVSDGFVIERGGEGFVARSEALPALVRDLGLPDGELIGQAVLRSYGFDGQALRTLRPGEAATLLGFQVPREELGRGIRSMRAGMGSLVDALARALEAGGARMRLGTRVRSLEARDPQLRVHTETASVEADFVLVATTASAAAPLLAPLVGDEAVVALARAATVSSVTVELAFARGQIAHPLDGTGFVVALGAQEQGVRACTFTSSKFAGRAPAGQVSIRVFIRPTADELATLSDLAWIARAEAGLRRVLAIDGAPQRTWVSIWPNALPVFDDAHRAAVSALEARLASLPVLLAGSAFHGSGIDAAICSGERAASQILVRCGGQSAG